VLRPSCLNCFKILQSLMTHYWDILEGVILIFQFLWGLMMRFFVNVRKFFLGGGGGRGSRRTFDGLTLKL